MLDIEDLRNFKFRSSYEEHENVTSPGCWILRIEGSVSEAPDMVNMKTSHPQDVGY